MKGRRQRTAIGTGTIFPTDKALSNTTCEKCKQRSRCLVGGGIPITVRDVHHLYIPDYKELWTLFVDLPDCKQVNKVFSLARISAHLYTRNKTQIEGKIIENRISQSAEIDVVEI